MNFFKNFSNIRGLLLFVAVGLLTTTLSAQTVVENTGESPTTEGRRDDTTAKDAKEKEAEIKKEAAKIKKQAEPRPPRFGGHVGVVIPLIARGNGRTTTIADGFAIGFPVALIVRTNSPLAFDFEFVPTINTPSNQDFRFLIHPGVVYGFKKHYAVGIRAAYEVGTGNYGFTPIASRSFKLTKKTRYFVEAVFPVRWDRRPNRSRFGSIGFAVHSGISF